MKDQRDVTCFFISLLMYSTYFGLQYIHYQELATMLLNYHIGRFVVGLLCFGGKVRLCLSSIRAVGFKPTARILLKPNLT